jgi:hypothetical protein
MSERIDDSYFDEAEVLETPFTIQEKLDALFVDVLTANKLKTEYLKNVIRFGYGFDHNQKCEQVTVINLVDEENVKIQRPYIDEPFDSKIRESAFDDDLGGMLYRIRISDLMNRAFHIKMQDDTEHIVQERNYEIFEDRIRMWGQTAGGDYLTADVGVDSFEYEFLIETIEKAIGVDEIIRDYDTKNQTIE